MKCNNELPAYSNLLKHFNCKKRGNYDAHNKFRFEQWFTLSNTFVDDLTVDYHFSDQWKIIVMSNKILKYCSFNSFI